MSPESQLFDPTAVPIPDFPPQPDRQQADPDADQAAETDTGPGSPSPDSVADNVGMSPEGSPTTSDSPDGNARQNAHQNAQPPADSLAGMEDAWVSAGGDLIDIDPSNQPTSIQGHLPTLEDAAPELGLTEFLDLGVLQEVQDSFTAVTRLPTIIRDTSGRALTRPSDPEALNRSEQVLDFLLGVDADPTRPDGQGLDQAAYVAPIAVDGREFGYIEIAQNARATATQIGRTQLRQVAEALGVAPVDSHALVDAAEDSCGPNKSASVQLLYILANAIARLCYQEHQLRHRIQEISSLYRLSKALEKQTELADVLHMATRITAEVMKVKACAIRLLDRNANELVRKAAFGLSDEYLNKGAVTVSQSDIFSRVVEGHVVQVDNMQTDPRIIYPQDAKREGIVSALCAGMVHNRRRIGAIQVYSAQQRAFSREEKQLLKAIAQQLAAAIDNARLREDREEAKRVQHQLKLAADVQKRLLPRHVPTVPPFQIATRYVPCNELGGDFYDLIDLDDNIGFVVGDVVGKGIAASLLMASVRSALRAYAQDIYDIDEILARVNVAMCRDTLDNEFATLCYGVLDPRTGRFTYCNAGHDPPLLLRDGEFKELSTGGLIVGVDPDTDYDKAMVHLKPGDLLLFYTDGLPDARSFEHGTFGRDRIRQAMLEKQHEDAHTAMNHILWEMRRFVGMSHQVDDITLVVLKVDENGILPAPFKPVKSR